MQISHRYSIPSTPIIFVSVTQLPPIEMLCLDKHVVFLFCNRKYIQSLVILLRTAVHVVTMRTRRLCERRYYYIYQTNTPINEVEY